MSLLQVWAKVELVSRILRTGHHVHFSDIDVVYLRDVSWDRKGKSGWQEWKEGQGGHRGTSASIPRTGHHVRISGIDGVYLRDVSRRRKGREEGDAEWLSRGRRGEAGHQGKRRRRAAQHTMCNSATLMACTSGM